MEGGLTPALESLLLEMAEAKVAFHKLNGDYYVTSTLEDGYLYHMTTWKSLKNILRDGFISGNPAYLARKGIRQKHEGMVSFTTSKWRHLSDLPHLLFAAKPCYLRIPFDALRDVAKPVVYRISAPELGDLIEGGCAYLFSTLTQNVEKLQKLYGADFERYLYHTWYVENEWRVKAERLPLPPETEVYVCSRHQLKVARQLTNLPVYLDLELMKFCRAVNEPYNKIQRIRRAVGADFFKKIKYIDIRKGEVERPDGSVSVERAILYDVGFLDAQVIVRRLNGAGFTCWVHKNAWKYRPYANVEVDLKRSAEKGGGRLG